MSQNNFHSLYVAPLIVTVLGAILSAGIGAYYLNSSPTPPPPQPPTAPPAIQDSPTAEVEFPKDAATQSLLREFLQDPATAQAKYQGKEVQVSSVIALVDPSGVLELYGATKNQVEGMYFRCSLQGKGDVKRVEPSQLVTLKGRLQAYVHHRKSPQIVLEGCRLVQP